MNFDELVNEYIYRQFVDENGREPTDIEFDLLTQDADIVSKAEEAVYGTLTDSASDYDFND
jgi:hypothetical protein